MKERKWCMAYVMHEERILGEPDMEYFRILDEGYGEWNFDTDILDRGLADSIGIRAAREYIERYQRR